MITWPIAGRSRNAELVGAAFMAAAECRNGGIHCAGSDLQLVGYAGFAAVWQASSIAKGVDCERRMVDGERTVDQGDPPMATRIGTEVLEKSPDVAEYCKPSFGTAW